MKQHIYCRSGISHSRQLSRIEVRSSRRNQYSAQEKIRILCVIQTMVNEQQLTYSEAASALSIDQSMISRWRKKEAVLGTVERPDALQLHSGPRSVLSVIESDLLEFVDTWRSKGLPVNRMALMRKAQSLLPELQRKSEHAVKMSISRFMKKNRLVHRMATHKAQRHPSEVENEALQFLDYIRPILVQPNRDPDYMYNMDQTPIWMAMDDKMTIDKVGTRTVNLRTSACDTKRVTVAVTLTASGRRVKSMVVFKGKKKYINYYLSRIDSFHRFFSCVIQNRKK
jgi:transposase-like protein